MTLMGSPNGRATVSGVDDKQQRRVLVVDDDAESRENVVELLTSAGHLVLGLPSLIGATRAILSAAVEVVVLHVLMPSPHADKLVALLATNPRLRHVAVVLVTNGPAIELQNLASRMGASAIVGRSRLLTELAEAVRLARRRA